MPRDPLLHIHRLDGEVCIACGDSDTSDTDFLTSPGKWNSEKRTCSPSARVSPDFVLTPRQDPRTSALKSERRVPRAKKGGFK